MANIVLLLVIIMLVFSVIGVTLFRDIVPMYFGNLSSCIFSLQYLILILFTYYLQNSWKRNSIFNFTLITFGNIATPEPTLRISAGFLTPRPLWRQRNWKKKSWEMICKMKMISVHTETQSQRFQIPGLRDYTKSFMRRDANQQLRKIS